MIAPASQPAPDGNPLTDDTIDLFAALCFKLDDLDQPAPKQDDDQEGSR